MSSLYPDYDAQEAANEEACIEARRAAGVPNPEDIEFEISGGDCQSDCPLYFTSCPHSGTWNFEKMKKELMGYLQVNTFDIFELADLIFPAVSGHYDAKLALMCLLANPWDSDVRERIHVMLFGKPGCGKTSLSEILEEEWGALFISCDPKKSSMKSDGRREDGGVHLLKKFNGGIICLDDFEKMPDRSMFRDVMERGRYTDAKSGKYDDNEAQCRLVATANDLSKIDAPELSRFDLVIPFAAPDIEEAMEIVNCMIDGRMDNRDHRVVISVFFHLVWEHEPKYIKSPEIKDLFRDYFEKHGSKPGRWIRGAERIAKALARLGLRDIGPWEIQQALSMKLASDEVLEGLRLR